MYKIEKKYIYSPCFICSYILIYGPLHLKFVSHLTDNILFNTLDYQSDIEQIEDMIILTNQLMSLRNRIVIPLFGNGTN